MKNRNKIKREGSFAYWFMFSLLLLDAILLIALYSWGVFTSLKTTNSFLKNMIMPTWPWEWDFTNYGTAFSLFKKTLIVDGNIYYVGITGMFSNTLIYCLLTASLSTFTQWVMAYLVGRFRCRTTDIIYKIEIILLMIPIMGTLPAGLAYKKTLGLYDNWLGVFTGAIAWGGMPFLILYNFIRNVSMDTIEAARIDGANNLEIMFRIVFPQTINAFFIIYTTSFISCWNDYMTMVIWLPSYPSLAYGVYSFSTSTETGASLPPIQVAGSMLLALPVFIVFMIFREKILGGITVSVTK